MIMGTFSLRKYDKRCFCDVLTQKYYPVQWYAMLNQNIKHLRNGNIFRWSDDSYLQLQLPLMINKGMYKKEENNNTSRDLMTHTSNSNCHYR